MKALPVLDHAAEILAAITAGETALVVADTGAGKSTRIPRMLVEAGYRVLVTEPRRIAARALATYVAAEMGVPLGGLVGYHVGRAEPMAGPETRLLYVTDALALVRELMAAGGGYDVLVIDEAHEWSLPIEVLLAWARGEIARGAPFKLVLLSATIDAGPLATYLGTPDRPAPVVMVPGREHPIEDRAPCRRGYDLSSVLTAMAEEIGPLARAGRNVLAFVPGKGEIDQLSALLEEHPLLVLPLHGGLTQEEQDRCFLIYDQPICIVATNIAQTSLTINGVDAVVDSGFERRVETSSGVEGIYLGLISRASARQRRGRAGRTRPGIYIDHAPAGPRELYSVPEIQRVLLDQAVLRLACAGLDAAALTFMHQPAPAEIVQAKRTLFNLGAMTAAGAVTAMGATIAKLPVSVRAGRALVEASRRGGRALLREVALACALADVGGIGEDRARDEHGRVRWRRFLGRDLLESDVLAQIHAFHAVDGLDDDDELEAAGFRPKKVKEAREQLVEIDEATREVLGSGADPLAASAFGRAVVLCMAAGQVDQLRCRTWDGRGWPAFGPDARRIARESVVDPGPRQEDDAYDDPMDGEWEGSKSPPPAPPLWVVGIPFDIGGRRGEPIRVLRFVSVVDPEEVLELAPEHVERTLDLEACSYDRRRDVTMAMEQTQFFGRIVAERRIEISGARRAGRHIRLFMAEVLSGREKIQEKETAPHLVALRDLVAGRARAASVNAALGEEVWPQPTTDRLLEQIADDATRLEPLLSGMATPAPAAEELERIRRHAGARSPRRGLARS